MNLPSAPPTSALSEALNGLLDRGAAVSGSVVISLGGVDLVYLDLRLLLVAVQSEIERQTGAQHV
jgi:hypothetical protein